MKTFRILVLIVVAAFSMPAAAQAQTQQVQVAFKSGSAKSSESAAQAVAKMLRAAYSKSWLAPKMGRGLETQCGRPYRNIFQCSWWIIYGRRDKRIKANTARDGAGGKHYSPRNVFASGSGQAQYVGRGRYIVAID